MLGICSQSSRRDRALMLMAYKLINGVLLIPDILTEIGFYVLITSREAANTVVSSQLQN